MVHLEPLLMNFDEKNINETLKIETHPAFINSTGRQAEIFFSPHSNQLVHSNLILF